LHFDSWFDCHREVFQGEATSGAWTRRRIIGAAQPPAGLPAANSESALRNSPASTERSSRRFWCKVYSMHWEPRWLGAVRTW
jgi:hypothetical protein